MKTKFTILVAAGLFFAVSSQAQGHDSFKQKEGYSNNSHVQAGRGDKNYEKGGFGYNKHFKNRHERRAEKHRMKMERKFNHRHHNRW